MGFAIIDLPINSTDILENLPSEYLNVWNQSDTPYYIGIAVNGYDYINPSPDVAFLPVYPLMIRFAQIIFPNPIVAGLIVSHICFFFVLLLLYQIIWRQFDDQEMAQRTVLYVSLFPTTFYFSSVYTESLFLLLVLLIIWTYQKGWWWVSVLIGMFASATRVPGLLVIILPVVEWGTQNGFKFTTVTHKSMWLIILHGLKRDWYKLLAFLCIPLGFMIYQVMLILQSGIVDIYFQGQSQFGNSIGFPWDTIALTFDNITGAPRYFLVINLFLTGIFFMMLVVIYRRVPLSWIIYGFASLLLPLSTGPLLGLMRFILVVFPSFIGLARLGKNKIVHLSFITLSLCGLCIATISHANGAFFG